MTIAFLRNISALVAAATVMCASVASAEVIYDNSALASDQTTRYNPGTNRVGDEIFIAGTSRFLTNFSFQYYGLSNGIALAPAFSGAPEVQIQFYLNDGPQFNGYDTPGTVFYSSSWFLIPNPTPRNTLVYDVSDGINFYLPTYLSTYSNFTWTVQFRGLGVDDELGVDIYTPPVVGSDLNDFWFYNGASWSLQTNAAVDMNFASRFEATVPEPSSLALAFLGGMGFLALRSRIKKK